MFDRPTRPRAGKTIYFLLFVGSVQVVPGNGSFYGFLLRPLWIMHHFTLTLTTDSTDECVTWTELWSPLQRDSLLSIKAVLNKPLHSSCCRPQSDIIMIKDEPEHRSRSHSVIHSTSCLHSGSAKKRLVMRKGSVSPSHGRFTHTDTKMWTADEINNQHFLMLLLICWLFLSHSLFEPS